MQFCPPSPRDLKEIKLKVKKRKKGNKWRQKPTCPNIHPNTLICSLKMQSFGQQMRGSPVFWSKKRQCLMSASKCHQKRKEMGWWVGFKGWAICFWRISHLTWASRRTPKSAKQLRHRLKMSKAPGLDQSSNMRRILLQTQTVSKFVRFWKDLLDTTKRSGNQLEWQPSWCQRRRGNQPLPGQVRFFWKRPAEYSACRQGFRSSRFRL